MPFSAIETPALAGWSALLSRYMPVSTDIFGDSPKARDITARSSNAAANSGRLGRKELVVLLRARPRTLGGVGANCPN
ncbi:hypothetical protein ON010_g11819 [Phytophthora cinnamomi]|nr:hypothetical protein ON010_g11819 [Phytophthora cinnamomi]